MGAFDRGSFEGIDGSIYVDWIEETTKQKKLLAKKGSSFYYTRISQIFSRTRFQAITRCLHVINPASYVREREIPGYDKMGQVHWLVNDIRDSFKRN